MDAYEEMNAFVKQLHLWKRRVMKNNFVRFFSLDYICLKRNLMVRH